VTNTVITQVELSSEGNFTGERAAVFECAVWITCIAAYGKVFQAGKVRFVSAVCLLPLYWDCHQSLSFCLEEKSLLFLAIHGGRWLHLCLNLWLLMVGWKVVVIQSVVN